MAVFVCRDTTTTYKVYDENFTVLYSGTLTGGIYWFACNRDDGCFYVSENAVLTKRSLTDGALISTQFESVGAQKPIVVDINGYLWTIDNTPSNVIRKWAGDLSSRTDYTIKAGVIDDYISNMVMTYDGSYIYIAGGHGTESPTEDDVKIAKLAISDLSGNAVWEKELYNETSLNYFYIVSMVVDESNNLYICGRYSDGTCLGKLSNAGTVLWEDLGGELFGSVSLEEGWVHYVSTWGIYFYIAYSQTTQSIYVCSVDNDFNSYIKQRQISDGDIIGSTAEFDWGYATCCAVYDSNSLFVGSVKLSGQTLNRLFTFDIVDNWGEDEAASTSNLLINKPIWAAGDPTGYLKSKFLVSPVAAFSGTPRTGNAPLTVTFTDSSTGSPTSWAWNFGDTETSTSQNPSHVYNSAGVYTVALIATNGAGSDTETKTNYIDVHDGNVESMLDELAMRLEDAEQRAFPETVKLKALHQGQLELTKFIADNFVPELQTIHSDLDCSSGEIALSSLTYNVLKDKEGVIGVRVTIDSVDYWAVKIDLMEIDRLENEYFYADDEVLFYVQNATIKIVARDLTGATADVFYTRIPTAFTVYQSPDLQEYLYNLTLCLAEDYCYRIEGRYDRAQIAKDMALREIGLLNRKYEEQQQLLDIGIYIDDWS